MNKLSIEKTHANCCSFGGSQQHQVHLSRYRRKQEHCPQAVTEVGEACALYQDRVMTGLTCKNVQCDEIRSFVGMKEKNVPEESKGTFGIGDCIPGPR